MERRGITSGNDGKPGFFRRIINSLNEFFFPTSSESKNKRFSQIRNVSFFLAATLLFFFFEDHIAKFVQTEVADIQKGMYGGPSAPF